MINHFVNLPMDQTLKEAFSSKYVVDYHWLSQEGVRHIRVWGNQHAETKAQGFVDIYVFNILMIEPPRLTHPWLASISFVDVFPLRKVCFPTSPLLYSLAESPLHLGGAGQI